jgi:hypothetical protein
MPGQRAILQEVHRLIVWFKPKLLPISCALTIARLAEQLNFFDTNYLTSAMPNSETVWIAKEIVNKKQYLL